MKMSLTLSEFALLQTLSLSCHLVQLVKCRPIFLELNSKRLYRSSGKEKYCVNVLCSRPQEKRARRSRAVTKEM